MRTVIVVPSNSQFCPAILRFVSHAAFASRDCSSSTSVCSPSARSRTCMPSGAQVDPLDQQPDDPRLLGREELVPQRREVGDGLDDLALRHLKLVLRRRPCPRDDLGRAQQVPHLRDDRLLDLGRRHAAHGAFRVALSDGVGADIVPIQAAILARVRRRHRVAARREDQAAQQRRRLRARAVGASDRVLGEDGVHLVPGRRDR